MGYPVFRQGSLAGAAPYPDAFFTFWNAAADGAGFYDNDESRVVWEFDVNFYATDPALVEAAMAQAIKNLKKSGFAAFGKGRDVASDEQTHTGRGTTARYLERS
jgi:hypothetical protein